MEEECCKNCKYMHPCKALVNREWKWFSVCTMLCDEPKGFALVVEDEGMCEMFSGKEQSDG